MNTHKTMNSMDLGSSGSQDLEKECAWHFLAPPSPWPRVGRFIWEDDESPDLRCNDAVQWPMNRDAGWKMMKVTILQDVSMDWLENLQQTMNFMTAIEVSCRFSCRFSMVNQSDESCYMLLLFGSSRDSFRVRVSSWENPFWHHMAPVS